MRIYELGEGTPEVAVVGAIHGDEPCGARAIERFVGEDPEVERPVKLIVANEEALERGVRYVDEDLNRVLPGDPDGDTHEMRLAHELAREVRDLTTLSFHSTQSYDGPFAIIDRMHPLSEHICRHLTIDVLVETGSETDGRLIAYADSVEVECGLQGTPEATENATTLLAEYLRATDVLPGADAEPSVSVTDGGNGAVPVYRFGEAVPKPRGEAYEVFVENFSRVESGDVFAAVDGQPLTADREFYPILMSAYGYEDVFGYAGDHVGTL